MPGRGGGELCALFFLVRGLICRLEKMAVLDSPELCRGEMCSERDFDGVSVLLGSGYLTHKNAVVQSTTAVQLHVYPPRPDPMVHAFLTALKDISSTAEPSTELFLRTHVSAPVTRSHPPSAENEGNR